MTDVNDLDGFFEQCTVELATSIEESSLPFKQDSVKSIAFCWALNGKNGPLWYRATLNKFEGREIIELMTNLAMAEENNMLGE